MEWDSMYGQEDQPSLEDIDSYIDNELWVRLNLFIENTYNIKPILAYSRCSMQRGWNVKYQKSGKSLCTLYPMKGYFIALVVIGNRETLEAEAMLPIFSDYLQELYKKTPFSLGGRWLMINVTEGSILEDVINLIQLRVKPKNNIK